MNDVVFRPQNNSAELQQTAPESPAESPLGSSGGDLGSTPTFTPPKEKKPKGGKVWMILFVIMLLAAGALGWLYYQETQKEPEVAQNNNNQQQEEEPENAVYEAEVGKFKLELPSPYAITKVWDGMGEGAAITELEIGKFNSEMPGVVVAFDTGLSPLTIRATEVAQGAIALEDSFIIEQLEEDDNTTRGDDIQFAGVTARVYVSEGLGTTFNIVFVHGDIPGVVYVIEVQESLDDPTYKAVEAGFSFITATAE